MSRRAALLIVSIALLLGGILATMLAGRAPVLQAYRAIALLAAIAFVWAVSPSRVVFGARGAAFDVWCVAAIAATYAPDAARIIGAPVIPAVRYLAPLGIAGLIACAAWRSTRPAGRDGALAALHLPSDVRFARAIVGAGLLLLFTAAVGAPAFLLATALAQAPLSAVIAGAIMLALLRYSARLRNRFPTLVSTGGILLALAGAFLARAMIELSFPIGAGSMRIATSASTAEGAVAALSTAGGIALLLVPLIIWRTLLLLRATRDHTHLPRWRPWAVGALIAVTCAALLVPPLDISWPAVGMVSGFARTASTASWIPVPPMIVLLVVVLAGLLAWGAAAVSGAAARYLMAVPMIAAIAALLCYALVAFAIAFVESGAAILLASASGWYAAVAAQGLLFGVTGLAIILGACGFLYEIARD